MGNILATGETGGESRRVPAFFGGYQAVKSRIRWTNESVLRLARNEDPVDVMEAHVRGAVLRAMDSGWTGPPFDPVELAKHLGLNIEPRSDIPDARTIASGDALTIEFNPLRPRGRVRFSVAHEIAHSFFPDCAQAVRNRGGNPELAPDDWQLEVLCNIGAAELLMPAGSFPELEAPELTISNLLDMRKRFDCSIEALLIRVAKLSSVQCAVFCASQHGIHYRLDYVIPSRSWNPKAYAGRALPVESLVAETNAIGYTAIGDETWVDEEKIRIECVGLAPYAGAVIPRAVGIIKPAVPTSPKLLTIEELFGDALQPRGRGRRIVAHVVPDNSTAWGGGGFAAQVRKRFPEVWKDFRQQASAAGIPLPQGGTFKGKLYADIEIAHMVAQRGFGTSGAPLIRYASLAKCLASLADWANELSASVHMPRIGTGAGGGDWRIIKELILDTVVAKGVHVTIYQLPVV